MILIVHESENCRTRKVLVLQVNVIANENVKLPK